jgi:hypothetical protein
VVFCQTLLSEVSQENFTKSLLFEINFRTKYEDDGVGVFVPFCEFDKEFNPVFKVNLAKLSFWR